MMLLIGARKLLIAHHAIKIPNPHFHNIEIAAASCKAITHIQISIILKKTHTSKSSGHHGWLDTQSIYGSSRRS